MLTVVDQEPFSGGRSKFKCQCECGAIKIFDGPKLNSGRIKSCGCFNKTVEGKMAKGFKNRLGFGESIKNSIISMYFNNARSRGIDISLSRIEMEKIMSLSCFYCGRPPYKKIEKKNFYGYFIYTGIDRMNPRMGYISSNVVPCCEQCNYLKNNYDYFDFLDIISRIFNNLNQKLK